jgi:hypothetical protein
VDILRKAALASLLALVAACASQAPSGVDGDEAISTEAEAPSKPDCRFVPTTRSRLGSRSCRS